MNPLQESGADEKAEEVGIESDDITLVVSQTRATRAAAAKALREASGDIVSAILALAQ